MNLASLTKEDLVFLDLPLTDKEQIIKKLVDALYENEILSSKEEFFQAVMDREKVSATGLEAGLAIPHGKSKAVKEAAFAVARLQSPAVNWESLNPDNQVKLVFLLAIPEAEAGSTHLTVLSELSKRLMDHEFVNQLMNAKTAKDFLAHLDLTGDKGGNEMSYEKIVLAVTSCATGIAHTYMAAEALEKAGRELGVRVITEKQGANGIEDEHSPELIKKADAVIFATDIATKKKERFAGLPYVQTKVADPLRNAKGLIQKALNHPDGVVEATAEETDEAKTAQKKDSIWVEMGKAVMTGISYMIPILVAGGLMLGIAKLGASAFGIVSEIGDPKYATDPNALIVLLHYFDKLGGIIMRFMFPIFATFVSYAIADRVGIVSGFIGGVFASGLHFTLTGMDGIPSGFLGALVLGLTAGYVSRFLNEKIKLSKNLAAIKPMLLIPGISVLVIFLLNFYIVEPVFGNLNLTIQNLIVAAQDAGTYGLAAIIAAATAFDLGGPVNKAAGAIAMGLAADGIYPLTPRVLSIIIPPIGLGLATIIDRFVVGRRVFDDALRMSGNTSLVLGFLAISEGALPFMLKNPLLTVPINIIGSILGSWVAIYLGAVQWLPLPAIWGWPLAENVAAYIIGLLVGVLFIALANIFIRFWMIKRNEGAMN